VSSDWGWDSTRMVYVTTFDLSNGFEPLTPESPDPKIGETSLEDAVGETLFATRFDDSRAYIVTYFMVDPLFVLDLSDPANPIVAGELKVPGWSTHIEPQGDTLIALGVDDTDGRRVCVSMFDVSDPAAPTMIGERVSFGENWSWSSAYNDVKAFTVLDDLLIVPFSGYESNYGGYDRLQFISYSPDGLAAQGYVDVSGSVLRSFEYDGLYYGVTTEQLATIDATDLANPTVTNQLTLAEYIADFIELTPDIGVEVVSEYDSGKTFLRTVGLAKDPLGSVEVNVGSLMKILPYGQSVVLVGTNWDRETYESFYVVVMVDCSDPSNLVVYRKGVVNVEPYWGYWYGWGRDGVLMGVAEVDKKAKMAIAPGYMPGMSQGSIFLLGNTLVLRCYHDAYDTVIGSDTAYQGLALLDLIGADYTTVGLGYDYLVSLNAAGDKIYIGIQQEAALTQILNMFYPVVANYIIEFDPATATAGPAVNVPGTFVQYDPDNDVLTVRDDHWTTLGSLKSNIRTLAWKGGDIVRTLDEVGLPEGSSALLGRGSNVFISTYDSGAKLYALSVEDDGDLALSDGILVTKQWANLLEAHGDTAYLTIGNAIACYKFKDNGGTLEDLLLTMGYPLSMHFGTNHVYIPLGYSGIAELPL